MISAIRDRANLIAVNHGLPQVTSGILIAVDYAPTAKVTLLLFGSDGVPLLAAKLARHAAGEEALTTEYDTLRSLWSAGPRSVTAELPRPLALERIAGRLVLLSTAVRGAPLTVRYYTPGHVRDTGLVAADFAMAGAWLARFQAETRCGAVTLGQEMFEEWIRPTLDRYRVEVGWSDWESGLLDHLSSLCALFRGVRVPVVAVHGDYGIGNILLESGRVSGVVDWELGRPAGLPFSDLLKFATSYGSYLDRASPPTRDAIAGHPGWARARDRWGATPGWTNATGILYSFYGSGWFPELVRRFLNDHLGRLGVPSAASQLFLQVFLVEQVLALQQPTYRNGYRDLLRRVCQESASGRLRSPQAAL